MSSRPKLSPFYTTTSKDLVNQDADFWVSALVTLLQLYRSSSPETDSRAFAAAKLAGLGLAIHEHFSAHVDAFEGTHGLGGLYDPALVEVGLVGFDVGNKHTRRMEKACERNQS